MRVCSEQSNTTCTSDTHWTVASFQRCRFTKNGRFPLKLRNHGAAPQKQAGSGQTLKKRDQRIVGIKLQGTLVLAKSRAAALRAMAGACGRPVHPMNGRGRRSVVRSHAE